MTPFHDRLPAVVEWSRQTAELQTAVTDDGTVGGDAAVSSSAAVIAVAVAVAVAVAAAAFCWFPIAVECAFPLHAACISTAIQLLTFLCNLLSVCRVGGT